MRFSTVALLALLASVPLLALADAPPTSAPAPAAPQSVVASPDAGAMLVLARRCLREIEGGKIDRASLTDGANALLSATVVASFAKQLASIGDPSAFVVKLSTLSDGMAVNVYRVTSADGRHYVLYSFSYDVVQSKVAEIHFGPTSRT